MNLEKHKELGELAKLTAHFQRTASVAIVRDAKLRKLSEKFAKAFGEFRSALDDDLHANFSEDECRNVYYGEPSNLPKASEKSEGKQ
jgi:hypothetical protein